MSSRATQRMLVRLLFDPDLLTTVHQHPDSVSGWSELTKTEQADILNQDRRLFRADPHLRARHLQAYLKEFPASVFFYTSGQAWKLQKFFSSSEFHEAVEQWTSILGGFQKFLLRRAPENLKELIEFESQLCICRQERSNSKGSPGDWCLAQGILIFESREGMCEEYSTLLQRHHLTGPSVIEQLATPHDQTWENHSAAPALVLLERQPDGGIHTSEVPSALGELLRTATSPVSDSELITKAIMLGADDENEAREIIESFREEGLLVRF